MPCVACTCTSTIASIREDAPAAMTARLRNFTYVYPYLRRIYLADRQGVVLSSSDPGDVGRSVFDISPGLREQLRQRVAAAGRLGRAGEPRPRIATPTTQTFQSARDHSVIRKQHVGGVLVAEMLDAPFEEMLRDISERAIGAQQAYLMESAESSC